MAQFLTARVPTCVGTSALLLHLDCAIRSTTSPNNPDGALLCPVAYPLPASFLVTATTGDGAFFPVDAKCKALGKTCQVFQRFSSSTANPFWESISSFDICAYRRRVTPVRLMHMCISRFTAGEMYILRRCVGIASWLATPLAPVCIRSA
jgi:hypothetical protein